jgi:hypothetical protein
LEAPRGLEAGDDFSSGRRPEQLASLLLDDPESLWPEVQLGPGQLVSEDPRPLSDTLSTSELTVRRRVLQSL